MIESKSIEELKKGFKKLWEDAIEDEKLNLCSLDTVKRYENIYNQIRKLNEKKPNST